MSKRRTENDEETLRRFFGDLPVIDADESLRVITNDDDVRNAVRKDPRKCVFAQACRRLFGATTVLVFRSIAYVDLPDENNKRAVNRFTVSPNVRERLEAWDAKGVAYPGGYLFKAPQQSRRLDEMRRRAKTYKAKGHKKKRRNPAYIKGHAISVVAGEHELRSVGTGLVQMLKTGKAVA
jgi:hypothetical protein